MNRWATKLSCLWLALMGAGSTAWAGTNSIPNIAELRQLLRDGAVLVDVRTAAEYAEEHLPGAVNVPLDRIAEWFPQHVPDKNRFILIHCRSGRRSAQAEQRLRKLGYSRIINLGSFAQAQRLMTAP
ncbi:MAG: rhodanese-like domain-containing protein [Verrucomicrobiae bacterium]|nr:rhodanese-like domain-containing protein [Verrucomicrobiae bacterium]